MMWLKRKRITKKQERRMKSIKFENGQFYYDNNEYTYLNFLKKYLWLHICIIILLIVAIFLTICIYSSFFTNCKKLSESDCWSTIISFTIGYIGSAFLGLIVFYNTCQRQFLEDREAKLKFNLITSPFGVEPTVLFTESMLKESMFKWWGGQTKSGSELETGEKSYLKFKIKNYNYRYPMYVDVIGAYYGDSEGKIVEVKSLSIKSTVDKDAPLDYKDEGTFYIGISNSLLSTLPKDIAYVFKLRNVKDIEEYCVYFVMVDSRIISGVIQSISIKDYDKSMGERGHPLGKWDIRLAMRNMINKK